MVFRVQTPLPGQAAKMATKAQRLKAKLFVKIKQ
jgi:hypothetical protein